MKRKKELNIHTDGSVLIQPTVNKGRPRKIFTPVNDCPFIALLDTTDNGTDYLEVDENCSGCAPVRHNLFRRILSLGETRFDAGQKAMLSLRQPDEI